MTGKKRAESVLAVVVNESAREIVFNVKGGGADGGNGSITFHMDKCSPENVAYASLHGFNQRLRDMAALSVNKDTGKSASAYDKFEAIRAGIEHYEAGGTEWHMKGSGGRETITAEVRMLAEAIAQVKGKNVVDMIVWVKSKTAAERMKLAGVDSIKTVLDELRAKAAETADKSGDDMLAELEPQEEGESDTE